MYKNDKIYDQSIIINKLNYKIYVMVLKYFRYILNCISKV